MKFGITAACTLAILMIFSLPFQGSAQERQAAALPAGKDAELLAEHCTKCHNLDEVARLRQTREQWEDTVYSMVARGAPVYMDEAGQIIDYLSRTFGPNTPP